MEHASYIPSLAWVVPFVLLLLGVAVLPLAAPALWESNLRKFIVSVVMGLPVLVLYTLRSPETLVHTAVDYASFMVLLASLFVISGGVFLDGDLEARPWVNTAFLGFGAVFASFVGTTGASMLLIRPLLRTNSERRYVVHTVVFFIFIVSNIGGCLTPLGDPPLFLGYLQGVPFTWTLRLAPAWLLTNAALLLIYFVWDSRVHEFEPPERLNLDRTQTERLRLVGVGNLALLAGTVMAAAFLDAPWRELAMIALTAISIATTSADIRRANQFSYHPILEVAAVFAGIFLTMMPALDLLRARGGELGLSHPWQYFWATGILSSFLDNAPTYLTFLALGQGQNLAPEVVGVPHDILTAISLGAVFMGANTYIGNGPNFMVRAIAESRGVKMPGMGGFMLYSGAILTPLFVLITLIFFRG